MPCCSSSGKQMHSAEPLHGTRFTPRFHIFVAAWRWENELKFRWPRLSAQYHKAWAASFPIRPVTG
jgi:hypothetical protein